MAVHSVAFRFAGSGAIPLKHHALSDVPPPSSDRVPGLERELTDLPDDLDLGTPVATPEYVDRERSEPVAYVAGSRPQIRVVFRAQAGTSETTTIGATGPDGGVSRRSVELRFDPNGLSDSIEFELAASLPLTVGRHALALDWFIARGDAGSPTPIGSTEHAIYVTAGRPNAPWDTEVAWVDALDLACAWAGGAAGADEAATAITRALNAHPQLRYHGKRTFGPDRFFLSSFLRMLRDGGVVHMNCTDCADAVVALANLLGCDLHAGRVIDLETRRFLRLGGDPANDADWIAFDWDFHELAWRHGVGPRADVYDASLQLDADRNDADEVHVPQLAAQMAFERYRELLVVDGPCKLADASTRRAIA